MTRSPQHPAMRGMTEEEKAAPWRQVTSPTVEVGADGYSKHTHPAFGTISASRVTGHANLFGSNVGHEGFVEVVDLEVVPEEELKDRQESRW